MSCYQRLNSNPLLFFCKYTQLFRMHYIVISQLLIKRVFFGKEFVYLPHIKTLSKVILLNHPLFAGITSKWYKKVITLIHQIKPEVIIDMVQFPYLLPVNPNLIHRNLHSYRINIIKFIIRYSFYASPFRQLFLNSIVNAFSSFFCNKLEI